MLLVCNLVVLEQIRLITMQGLIFRSDFDKYSLNNILGEGGLMS